MMRRAITTSLFLCILLLCATFVYAQSEAELYVRSLTLKIAPDSPAANTTVRLSVTSSSVDLDRSTLTWRVNGKQIAQGVGITAATVTTGAPGIATTVDVSATDSVGTVKASGTIRPAEVDLLWQADSYVPPFYKGRALAGPGSVIRVQAIPRLKQSGSFIPEKDVMYTWYRNNTRLNSSGTGKSRATIQGPDLFGAATIAVVAESRDGLVRATASATIVGVDSIPGLYENHPLFGILYHRAVLGDVSTLETEEKVIAVSYFAPVDSLNDPSLAYDWRVNGGAIAPDSQEPQTLTIRANNYSGPATIDLSVTSTADVFFRATGSWRLVFGKQSLFGTNPFAQ